MGYRRWTGTFADGALSEAMARLNARHPWSHNDHFHGWVLANLPERRRLALDVGCGRGELVATLAPHLDRVIGNDRDPAMRAEAARRCAGLVNVTITGDDWVAGTEPLDLVTMIAVLHHLDVPAALRQIRRRLAPGGRFLSVGLHRAETARDHAWDIASAITNPLIGYVKHPWPRRIADPAPPFPIRDPTLSLGDLRRLLAEVMPGAEVRHHLGFRHTIAWTKPA